MKDKYEISLWEDISTKDDSTSVRLYEERKIAIIGAHDMTAPYRALEPKLVENINGTNTFTFKMYYRYIDENGEKKINPFVNLLVNERKVKVHWKEKWYEFLIRKIQEDSSGKSITYTCTDLYVNELSKNGFNLEFDTELENNQGTNIELAMQVLDGTDWHVIDDEGNVLAFTEDKDVDVLYTTPYSSDAIRQEKEEPVYEITLGTNITATNYTKEPAVEEVINKNSIILGYYNQFVMLQQEEATSGEIDFEFLYSSDGYKVEPGKLLVINGSYYTAKVNWSLKTQTQANVKEYELFFNGVKFYTYVSTQSVSSSYRAKKLVNSQVSVLDPYTKRYCDVFTAIKDGEGEYEGLFKKGDVIYKSTYSDKAGAVIATNLFTNDRDFESIAGWTSEDEPRFTVYPDKARIQQEKVVEISRDTQITSSDIGKTYYYYVEEGAPRKDYIIENTWLDKTFGEIRFLNDYKNPTQETHSELEDLIVQDHVEKDLLYLGAYKKGSSGNYVKLLQMLLNFYYGKELVEDGSFGELTYNAVKEVFYTDETEAEKVIVSTDQWKILYDNIYNDEDHFTFLQPSKWEQIGFYTVVADTSSNSFLKLEPDVYYNSGLTDFASRFTENMFVQGEQYIFRYQMHGYDASTKAPTDSLIQNGVQLKICNYDYVNHVPYPLNEQQDYFKVDGASQQTRKPAMLERISILDYPEENTIYYYKEGKEYIKIQETLPTDMQFKKLKFNGKTRNTIFKLNTELYVPNRFYTENGTLYKEETLGTQTLYEDIWTEYVYTCTKTLKLEDLAKSKIGMFLISFQNQYLRKVEFFKLAYGEEDIRLEPNSIDTYSVYNVYNEYYNHTDTKYDDENKIIPIYKNIKDWDIDGILVPEMNNFKKILSITAKESNRFNIIQSIAETFQCWPKFIIEHDETGKIITEGGIPKKYLIFRENVGEESGLSFTYGLDLKQIQRSIDSDKITTKTIVKPNSNEFAQNGFCTIQRSKQNYPKTNFILNFDYYGTHGLIDLIEVNNDLYNTSMNYIGYYTNLHNLNTAFDAAETELAAKEAELIKRKGDLEVSDSYIKAANEKIKEYNDYFSTLAGGTDQIDKYIVSHTYITELMSKLQAKDNLSNKLDLENSKNISLKSVIAQLDERIKELKKEQESLRKQIKDLDQKFYNKYSRFIQEGTWIKEDYYDDDLYYIDAQNVAYTSGRPQVSYTISVLRLTGIEEFKHRVFKLGDTGYVQDDEFFGKDNGGNPYKEQILISEITSNFDEPDKDSIKVQNYKTQFEDLFQRITAQTQSLTFAQGDYNRAASTVSTNGTIKSSVLQESFDTIADLSMSDVDNNVVYESGKGIMVTDSTNTNNILKITSNGILISRDGGTTWTTAINSAGISTSLLSPGAIRTGDIAIVDGNCSTFRWDSTGLNAYAWNGTDNEGKPNGINLSKFVRFDRYGIYGLQLQDEASNTFFSEQDVWDAANFGLTWNGFFLKNKENNGSIEISTDDDMRIVENGIERIKIGRLFESTQIGYKLVTGPFDWTKTYYIYNQETNKYEKVNITSFQTGVQYYERDNFTYGIRIRDGQGNSVMETDDSGELWLKKFLKVGESNSKVTLGYDSSDNTILNSEYFQVYTDGSIKATKGQIANITIEENKLENDYYSLSENGIEVFNGGINIYEGAGDEKGALLFGFDNEKNQLQITGEINASSGTFNRVKTGNINLTKDLTNEEYYYSSASGKFIKGGAPGLGYIFSQGFDPDKSSGFYIDGNGIIQANNLRIGGNAYLKGLLRIGNAIIKEDQGIMKLGGLSFDGSSSTISGANWSISPSQAIFNNVNVSGKITSVIFETKKTSIVGGQMLFKPAFKVIARSTYSYILENYDSSQIQKGDYVQCIGSDGVNYGTYVVIENQTQSSRGKGITIDTKIPIATEISQIIHIGPKESILIGINSNDTSSDFMCAQGMTISQFNSENSKTLKAFIGNLEKLSDFGSEYNDYSGYGLYASNVYLRGSLTTEYEAGSDKRYSGINTLGSAASFTKSMDTIQDTSKIVFWGGSEGQTSTDIQNSLFQVTDAGTLYSQRAIITGDSIFQGTIYGSTIESSELRTAKIVGNGTDGAPGLTFENLDKAIVFANQGKEIFKLTQSGLQSSLLTSGDDYEIAIVQNTISFGQFGKINSQIMSNTDNVLKKTYINSVNGEINFGSKSEIQAIINERGLTVQNELLMGDSVKPTLEYRQAKNGDTVVGYDLYISAG